MTTVGLPEADPDHRVSGLPALNPKPYTLNPKPLYASDLKKTDHARFNLGTQSLRREIARDL